jgi:DNA-binding HxlR family transcriptional regulator
MAQRIDWAEANKACEALGENQESLAREIVSTLADKWTLWTMAELAEADAPMRFTRLMEKIEGVSQKSLTKVLRQLERDGMVTREVFAEVPLRVEYKITDVALEMLALVHPLWLWATTNASKFEKARANYDATHKVV